MTNVKIQFKPGMDLFGALCLIRSINHRVVIVDNYTFLLSIGITDFDVLKRLQNNPDIKSVSVYKNDVETIRGLFQEDD